MFVDIRDEVFEDLRPQDTKRFIDPGGKLLYLVIAFFSIQKEKKEPQPKKNHAEEKNK